MRCGAAIRISKLKKMMKVPASLISPAGAGAGASGADRPTVVVAMIYLVLISSAEIIGALQSQRAGIAFQTLVFFMLVVHAAINIKNPLGKMLLSLTLAPITRIASYSVPQLAWRPFATYILIYFPIGIATALVMWRLKLKPRAVGLVIKSPHWQSIIASTGIAFGFIEYAVLRYPPLISELTWTHAWLPGVALLISTGLVEEFVFRGVMQTACEEALGKWNLAYVSYIFAILHVIHGSVLDIFLVFVIAYFFAWCVKRTGSLVGVILGHGITNSILFLVAPFVFQALHINF